MTKPILIWKGGRPRKAGPREPSGRPARNVAVLPPGMEEQGLAVSPWHYRQREVTERGQVVGRTVQRIGPLDRVPVGNGRNELDGDEWKALAEYERRHNACTVSVKSPLDRTPPGGSGLDGVMDWLRKAIDARQRLRRFMPPALWAHVDAVIEEREAFDLVKLREAARCLLVALEREKRAA
jgi:hypothetical protein